eukprot:Platyproteum_vivax@DN3095_c0_g1_i1.p1
MAETVGMMEGAFFVGKGELLAWLNDFFKLGLTKVEQLASGAVYAQIFDALYPGKVQMSKVNWGAKFDYEFIKNYKVLQAAFDKVGIKKHIEVDKLVKAKPLDNLEFIQWCKSYFDKTYCGQEYDPIERRSISNTAMLEWAKYAKPAKSSQGVRSSNTAFKARGLTPDVPAKSRQISAPALAQAQPKTVSIDKHTQEVVNSLENKVVELQEELSDGEATIEGLEKERDFYFRKLRDIEIICQEKAELGEFKQLVDELQVILYASDEVENSPVEVQAEKAGTPAKSPLNLESKKSIQSPFGSGKKSPSGISPTISP